MQQYRGRNIELIGLSDKGKPSLFFNRKMDAHVKARGGLRERNFFIYKIR